MSKLKRAALYLRVSTKNGQTTDNQRLELEKAAEQRGWEIVAAYEDAGISGAKGRNERPALNQMLNDAARHKFNLVAAWSVDRLGRSLQDLVAFLSELHALKIDLYLHKQGLDTATPAGKAMFGMLGVFAEFEREIIAERIHAGLARAKEHGTKSGRPIGRPRGLGKKGERLRTKVRRLRKQGQSQQAIADDLNISRTTVQTYLKD